MAFSGTIDGPFLMRQYLGLTSSVDSQNGADAPLQFSKRNIITGATTLTANLSGSLCLWNTAAGYTFTLPAPAPGLWFEFLCSITNTSVACKIVTGTPASQFLLGTVHTAVVATTPSSTAGPKAFAFDGTTHVACTMGGSDTTAGGVVGTRIRVEGISSTVWAITGNIIGSGTIVTPAATS